MAFLDYTGVTDLVTYLRSKFASLVGGLVAVSQGGTGKGTHTANAVLTGNGTSAVNNVSTASGALYAMAANGAAQFGTLPVAQGGTAGTTKAEARASLEVPVNSSIATVESTTATGNHAVGDHFMLDDKLMKATAAIAAGETINASKATPATVQGQIDTLRDSVSQYTSASGTGWYAVKKNGWVVIGLEGNNLSVTGQGATLFTLPVGFRPLRYINFSFTDASKILDGMVQPSGNVIVWPNGTLTKTRGQVVFPVDS